MWNSNFLSHFLRDQSLFMAGGIGFKSGGGHRKIVESKRVGIKKILRNTEWASKYFFVKFFAAGAASFVKSHYPCELQSNLLDLHNNSTPKIHEKFTSRVGVEKLSRDVEWAAKTFHRAMSGPPKIF